MLASRTSLSFYLLRICCNIPAANKYTLSKKKTILVTRSVSKLFQAAYAPMKVQTSATGKLNQRHLIVLTGWMNFKVLNILKANTITIIKMTCQVGWIVKTTKTTIFQQPGKPEKLLSCVFIRVSAKYKTEVKAMIIMQTHPDHPFRSPLTNRA